MNKKRWSGEDWNELYEIAPTLSKELGSLHHMGSIKDETLWWMRTILKGYVKPTRENADQAYYIIKSFNETLGWDDFASYVEHLLNVGNIKRRQRIVTTRLLAAGLISIRLRADNCDRSNVDSKVAAGIRDLLAPVEDFVTKQVYEV